MCLLTVCAGPQGTMSSAGKPESVLHPFHLQDPSQGLQRPCAASYMKGRARGLLRRTVKGVT